MGRGGKVPRFRRTTALDADLSSVRFYRIALLLQVCKNVDKCVVIDFFVI